jgi:hypothetical protein
MEDVVKISSLRQDIRDGRFRPIKSSVADLRRIFVLESPPEPGLLVEEDRSVAVSPVRQKDVDGWGLQQPACVAEPDYLDPQKYEAVERPETNSADSGLFGWEEKGLTPKENTVALAEPAFLFEQQTKSDIDEDNWPPKKKFTPSGKRMWKSRYS